ncbi:MAG TPA: hypothetical protein DEA96_05480 [Leptospiraceae bacterium]|nr:hypothetical protein [Spirochaetaceae bacterium]HBS04393.1 hypothetical protein [Leptospiraceae bacterium]
MKFAYVNLERKEATKGDRGVCIGCDSVVIPKCGQQRQHHWAHKSKKPCDYEREPETPWHRDWKNHFPEEWQEILQRSESGEKRRADVKTKDGIVLEFQHSPIDPEIRDARNSVHKSVVWVVNGTRLPREVEQFNRAVTDVTASTKHPRLKRILDTSKSGLLKKWSGCRSLVVYDFQTTDEQERPVLWVQFLPTDFGTYLVQLEKANFVYALLNGRWNLLVLGLLLHIQQAVQPPAHKRRAMQKEAIYQAALRNTRRGRQYTNGRRP